MSTDTQPLSITATTTVEVPIDEAFRFFTEEIGAWWNPDHHIIEAPLSAHGVRAVRGRERLRRGHRRQRVSVGTVLVYDRPHRVVFSWDINGHWTIETDHDKCSQVEVTFTAEGPGTTRVVLEHQHLERHGDSLVPQVDGIRTGWQAGLDLFAAALGRRG